MRVSIDRGWVLRWAPAGLALAFVLLQLIGMRQEAAYNDSYRYGMLTMKILGASEQEAHDESIRMICKRGALGYEQARTLHPVQLFTNPPMLDSSYADCVRSVPTADGFTPNSPRYQAIFENRYGYPLMSAPLVKVLGLERGMFLTAWLIAAGAGLMVFLLLRLFGATRGVALVGQVLFYVLPVGYWSARTLAEGSMVLTTLITIAGAWFLLQRNIKLGLALVVGGQLLGFLVKFSQVTMLSLTLVAAAVGIWLFDRQRRHLGTVLLAVNSILVLAVSLLVPKILGWPGFSESLQDTFTEHFANPDVDVPWYRFVMFNKAYWTWFVQEQGNRPLLLVAIIVGAVALWRWQRSVALLVVAAGMTGIATEVAHPMWGEFDRLYTPVWVIAAIGLPLVWSLAERRRSAAGATSVSRVPAEEAPAPAEPNPERESVTSGAPPGRTEL
ncbi:hypothetical protein [Micromonospora sp. NPDC004704]